MRIVFIIMVIIFFISIRHLPAMAMDFSKETIYFIVVDRFVDGDPNNNPSGEIFSSDKSEWKLYWGGDLKGIIDKLPYIKSLGATAIWITPVVENPDTLYRYGDEKIAAYHGYWGKDFKRINPYFGDMKTFDRLIEEAHKEGIKIILDIVLNHTSPINKGIDGAIYDNGVLRASYSKDPDRWFNHNGSTDFSILEDSEWENKNLFDLADLNQDNLKVDRYLKDMALMWASHGVDAFRIDTVRHVPCRYVKSFADEIYSKKDMFIFGEWSLGNFNNPEDKKFSLDRFIKFEQKSNISVIDFNFQKAITEILAGNKSFKIITESLELDKKAKDPYSWVTCVDNHDMPRFISTAIGNGSNENEAKSKFAMAIYLIMTSRGIPCIYYGSEHMIHNDTPSTWGLGGEPYNRQMMKDFSTDGDFFLNIGKLSRLRQDNPAVSRGEQKTIYIDDDTYIYERISDENIVLVAMNKGDCKEIEISVNLPEGLYRLDSENKKKVLGKCIKVKDGKVSIKLDKYEVGVWSYISEK